MKPWYNANSKLFQELKSSIANVYPTLCAQIENGIVYICGNLILYTPDGKELDHYTIEIELPTNYPQHIPIVRETGRRLPKISDRHFSKTGTQTEETACLFLPEERSKYWPMGSTIIDFIDGPVKDFFLWQTDYDLNDGKSRFGARQHADKGIIEFYKEEIGSEDKTVIKTLLEYLTKKEIKGHWLCYCGSGKKIRDCHINKLKELGSKISCDDAMKSFEVMEKYYKK